MSFIDLAVAWGLEGTAAEIAAGAMMGGSITAGSNVLHGRNPFDNIGQGILMGGLAAGISPFVQSGLAGVDINVSSAAASGITAGGLNYAKTGNIGDAVTAGLGAYGLSSLAGNLENAGGQSLANQDTIANAERMGAAANQAPQIDTNPYSDLEAMTPAGKAQFIEDFQAQNAQNIDEAANSAPKTTAKNITDRMRDEGMSDQQIRAKLSEAGKSAVGSDLKSAGSFLKSNARNLMYAASPMLVDNSVESRMPQTMTRSGMIRPYSYDPYSGRYTAYDPYEYTTPTRAADGGLMGYGESTNAPITRRNIDSIQNTNGMFNYAQDGGGVMRMAQGGLAGLAGLAGGGAVAFADGGSAYDDEQLKSIAAYLATNPTADALAAAQAQYGVSDAGVQQARDYAASQNTATPTPDYNIDVARGDTSASGNVGVGPYNSNAAAYRRPGATDEDVAAGRYSRKYSGEELANIAGTFDQYQTDPAKIMQLMTQYGVSVKDLAMARSGSANPETLQGYNNIFTQAGAPAGFAGMYTAADITPKDKAYINNMLAQPNHFGPGTMADVYKAKGIDPYTDAGVIAQAKSQNERADRRVELLTSSGQTPNIYDSSGQQSGQIAPWLNPNARADQDAFNARIAARDAANTAASPGVVVGGGIVQPDGKYSTSSPDKSTASTSAGLQASYDNLTKTITPGDNTSLYKWINQQVANGATAADLAKVSGYLEKDVQKVVDSARTDGLQASYDALGGKGTNKDLYAWVSQQVAKGITAADLAKVSGYLEKDVQKVIDSAKRFAPLAQSYSAIAGTGTPGQNTELYKWVNKQIAAGFNAEDLALVSGYNKDDIDKVIAAARAAQGTGTGTGTNTTGPNIPNQPTGGNTGVSSVTNAYTGGGGRTGYTPYVPTSIQDFNDKYNTQTNGSAQAYNYLRGKADYSPTPYTKTGEIAKPYSESVMGIPGDVTKKRYLFESDGKGGGKYVENPGYIPPHPYTAPAEGKKWSWNAEKKKWDQVATDTTTVESANGGLAALTMARGGSTHPPFFSKTTGKFNLRSPQVYADGGMADGGQYNLGGYSDGGRLLRGPGDGVSDSIPATIGNRQPAKLADGEFVVPARIVSELGNGSTEAGARKLYAMMDRVQNARRQSVGKGKVAKNSRADKYLPS